MLFSEEDDGDRMQQIFADRYKYLIDRAISIVLHTRLAPFPQSVKYYIVVAKVVRTFSD